LSRIDSPEIEGIRAKSTARSGSADPVRTSMAPFRRLRSWRALCASLGVTRSEHPPRRAAGQLVMEYGVLVCIADSQNRSLSSNSVYRSDRFTRYTTFLNERL
jgi:hypothetical protein